MVYMSLIYVFLLVGPAIIVPIGFANAAILQMRIVMIDF